ncbi:MAG: 4Fe-4S binding protein [bacterium]
MIHINRIKCDFCGTCVAVCPVDAIEILEYRVGIDEDACTNCLNCVMACPWGALKEQE